MNGPAADPRAPLPATQRGAGRPAALLSRLAFVCGSAGLLLAMTLDAAAVVGRHIGVPLLGSIELVQACIVLAASSALIGATLGRAHARVHVFSERLPSAARAALLRVGELLGALFFGSLAAGSIWVASELWGEREASELLGIPIAPLRAAWCASTIGIVALFVTRAVARRCEPEEAGREP
jgi:TRAP-type transport system small permease protein